MFLKSGCIKEITDKVIPARCFLNVIGVLENVSLKAIPTRFEKTLQDDNRNKEMLNKGLREQESIRIDNVLKKLMLLVYVPKFWNLEDLLFLENELKDLAMNVESLNNFKEEELIVHLQRLNLDWNQLELFADFLVDFAKESPFDFSPKAIAIYNHIQAESKTFSFGIFNKIVALKASL